MYRTIRKEVNAMAEVEVVKELLDFLNASSTPFHAVGMRKLILLY